MCWDVFQEGSFGCSEFVKRDWPCWEDAGIRKLLVTSQ